MSVSKLESLPNEILLDFLEKYANGVDIFLVFIDQFNSRFNHLIAKCQEFRFDFVQCRKYDFLRCLRIFPLFSDRITELALSEWNTPGQIDTFLSFYPLFTPFKKLRKLYFHFNAKNISQEREQLAIQSLGALKNLNTLSIKVVNNRLITLSTAFVLFRLATLKRLSVAVDNCNSALFSLEPFENISSNLEHLTITGITYNWHHLELTVRCALHLRYLNVRFTSTKLYRYQEEKLTTMDCLPDLQTLIIHFEEDDPTTFNMVARFLRSTPNLRQLEVTAHDALILAAAWEQIIREKLSNLMQFCLKTSTTRLRRRIINEILLSFQTPFWFENSNFNLLLLNDEQLLNDQNKMNHVYGRKPPASYSFISEHSTTEFQTAVERKQVGTTSLTNAVTSLCINRSFTFPSCQYYFNNVRYLSIANVEKNLIQWITEHVNGLRVEELDISLCRQDTWTILSLLSFAKNIKSLILHISQLTVDKKLQLEPNTQVRSLVVSDSEKIFNENTIQTIGYLFPCLEHLVIDIQNLNYIPILGNYLLCLRSLTFKTLVFDWGPLLWFQKNAKDQYVFQHHGDWMTVWIDSTIFENKIWQKLYKRYLHICYASNKRGKFMK